MWNNLWIAASAIILIMFICGVALICVIAGDFMRDEKTARENIQKRQIEETKELEVFESSFSQRWEMEQITRRLLKEDKRRKKYRRIYS